MTQNLYSKEQFRTLATAFIKVADAARSLPFNPENGLVIRGNVQFRGSPELWDTLRALTLRTVDLIGPTLCTEADIEEAAWVGAASEGQDIPKRVKIIADEISDSLKEHIFISSNYAVALQPSARKLKIGPVQIRSNTSIARELSRQGCRFKLKVGSGPDQMTGPNPTKYMSHFCWYVKVASTRARVPDEAQFLINAAVSFLRFSMLRGPRGNLFPYVGQQEHRPNTLASGANPDIVLQEPEEIFAGGGKLLRRYEVGKVVRDRLRSLSVKRTIAAIFEFKPNSVGERVLVGLHWLARCRQSEASSERFLYAFTAIEALLSSASTTSPVVQTVARRAAYLASQEKGARERIATMTKQLYVVRSNLVHRGNRSVSQADVGKLESLADIVYLSALMNIDLTKPFSDFENAIENASYGYPWPDPSLEPSAKLPF